MKKRHFKVLIIGLCTFVLISVIAFMLNQSTKSLQQTRFTMGTFFTITIYARNATPAMEVAFEEIDRVERLTNRRSGPVAMINGNAGQWVRVPEELFRLLQATIAASNETNQAFQPAIGSLVDLWGFGYDGEGRLPKTQAVAEQVKRLKEPTLALKEDTFEVRLAPGCLLDLGGVAKGYAVDRAHAALRRLGIKHALINGGDSSIRSLGTRPWGKPWRIALAHPRREAWVGVLQLPADAAVGTSADTQRYFISSGKRYSHLINPHSGYPASDVLLVTVVAPTAMEADIYSTAIFVTEGAERLKLIGDWGLIGYYIALDEQPHFSQGFQRLLRMD